MRNIQITIFILFSVISYGQDKIIKCFLFDKLTNKPVENAYVLSINKPIAISGEDGSIEFLKGEKILISHITYEKLEIPTSQLNGGEKFYLISQENALSEVKVSRTKNVENIIIESVKRRTQNYKQYFEQKFKLNHSVLNIKDTLVYFDGQINLIWSGVGDKYFTDKNSIINRKYFEITNRNSEYNFNIEAKRIFYGFKFIYLPFFSDTKKYNYYIERENEEFYEIAFAPQKEGEFNYEGLLKINKKDYGIISIDAKLLKHKNNNKTTIINNFIAADKYRFLEERIEYFFEKRNDSYYYFKSAFHVIKMEQYKIGKIENPKNFSIQTIILDSPNTVLKNEYRINLRDLSNIVSDENRKRKETKTQSKENIKEQIDKIENDEENN